MVPSSKRQTLSCTSQASSQMPCLELSLTGTYPLFPCLISHSPPWVMQICPWQTISIILPTKTYKTLYSQGQQAAYCNSLVVATHKEFLQPMSGQNRGCYSLLYPKCQKKEYWMLNREECLRIWYWTMTHDWCSAYRSTIGWAIRTDYITTSCK